MINTSCELFSQAFINAIWVNVFLTSFKSIFSIFICSIHFVCCRFVCCRFVCCRFVCCCFVCCRFVCCRFVCYRFVCCRFVKFFKFIYFRRYRWKIIALKIDITRLKIFMKTTVKNIYWFDQHCVITKKDDIFLSTTFDARWQRLWARFFRSLKALFDECERMMNFIDTRC